MGEVMFREQPTAAGKGGGPGRRGSRPRTGYLGGCFSHPDVQQISAETTWKRGKGVGESSPKVISKRHEHHLVQLKDR